MNTHDSGKAYVSPFSMGGSTTPAAPSAQGMQIAPAGYTPPALYTSPQQKQQQMLQLAQQQQMSARSGRPLGQGMVNGQVLQQPSIPGTIPQAGAQPAQGAPVQRPVMQQPPTGAMSMNPQYQQALISSLRANGQ
jgi:hypothetical protein